MKKYKLSGDMVKSIEYFRAIEGLSLYGILSGIVSERDSNKKFHKHSMRVLKHFNDFDNKEDDDNFMKCLLGHYKVVE